MVVETCTDAGGGQDMGYIDAGDYLVWNNVNFPTSGSYNIEYRVASGAGGGTISADLNAGSIPFGNTGHSRHRRLAEPGPPCRKP